MKYTKSGAQTGVGPADWFTGTVYIDGIRNPDEQSSVGCSHVRFTPGARTAWHHHPKGQTLYVTDGIGRAGSRARRLRAPGWDHARVWRERRARTDGSAPGCRSRCVQCSSSSVTVRPEPLRGASTPLNIG